MEATAIITPSGSRIRNSPESGDHLVESMPRWRRKLEEQKRVGAAIHDALVNQDYAFLRSYLRQLGGPRTLNWLLESCVKGLHIEPAEWLLKRGADPDYALPEACLRNYGEMVKLLVSYGATLGTPQDLPWRKFLDSQAWSSNTREHAEESALTILEVFKHRAGFDGKTLGWYLTNAIHHNYVRVVDYLIDAGANPKFQSACIEPPLSAAASEHNVQILATLIANGADVNATGRNTRSALLQAIETDTWQTSVDRRETAIRLLLDNGANPDIGSGWLWTPIGFAVDQNDVTLIRLLLSYGADVNLPNERGWSPLIHAARRGNPESVEILLQAGAAVGLLDHRGRTALICAARHGHPRVIQQLLAASGNPNDVDSLGRTPLMHAARKGRVKAAELLLEAGADLSLRDNDGHTALDLANPAYNPEFTRLLGC